MVVNPMELKEHRVAIFKFGLYGLLKNLRFFEPFFILFLLDKDISLFQIGLLYTIREMMIYIFEIPSGVFADRYGKKLELSICFMFYITSFIIFFLAGSFWILAIAMILFGLGEAFRSGTHKAMIMAYIDYHQIKASKTKVYGLTRSYSLIGSMISSLIAIVLVLWLPEIKFLFLVSIIPYLIDFGLILSYPNYIDQKQETSFHLKAFFKQSVVMMKHIITHQPIRNAVLNSSSFQASFKLIKDYVQPIIISLSIATLIFSQLTVEDNQKIYLGLIYALIYLLSAFASRYAHVLHRFGEKQKIVNIMWLLSGSILILLAFFIHSLWLVMGFFILLYMLMNARRPLMVEVMGDVTQSDYRSTVLSVESQMTSLWIAIFAPILGLIADYSISVMLFTLGLVMISIFIIQFFINRNEVA